WWEPIQKFSPAGLDPNRLAYLVDPAVEVAGARGGEARPEQQLVVAGSTLAGEAVALAGLGVAALADEVVALAGDRVGVGEVEQTLELAQRLGVVVDAHVDDPPPRLALRGGRPPRPPPGPPRAAPRPPAGRRRGARPA